MWWSLSVRSRVLIAIAVWSVVSFCMVFSKASLDKKLEELKQEPTYSEGW
jgi:hypothetical protein